LTSATLGDGEGGAGYRGYIVLLSPDGGRAVGITLWESEPAEMGSRYVAETIRPRLEAATGGKVVKVERYQVGFFDVISENT